MKISWIYFCCKSIILSYPCIGITKYRCSAIFLQSTWMMVEEGEIIPLSKIIHDVMHSDFWRIIRGFLRGNAHRRKHICSLYIEELWTPEKRPTIMCQVHIPMAFEQGEPVQIRKGWVFSSTCGLRHSRQFPKPVGPQDHNAAIPSHGTERFAHESGRAGAFQSVGDNQLRGEKRRVIAFSPFQPPYDWTWGAKWWTNSFRNDIVAITATCVSWDKLPVVTCLKHFLPLAPKCIVIKMTSQRRCMTVWSRFPEVRDLF